MAKALSRSTSSLDAVNSVLERWHDWLPGDARRPVLNASLRGKSNDNYLVTSGLEKFVVRINSDNESLGVDRSIEAIVLGDVSGRTFAPEVVWQDSACLITRFIDGAHPYASTRDDALSEMGRLFRSIHDTPASIKATLDPLRHALSYLEQLGAPIDSRLAACFERVLAKPATPVTDLCLCHNDLLFENVIRSGTTWHAIDWEYGRLGDPAFDIAVFVETMDVTPAGVSQLLAAYGNPRIASRIPYYRDLYRLIETLWWLLREPADEGHDRRIAGLATRLASGDH